MQGTLQREDVWWPSLGGREVGRDVWKTSNQDGGVV